MLQLHNEPMIKTAFEEQYLKEQTEELIEAIKLAPDRAAANLLVIHSKVYSQLEDYQRQRVIDCIEYYHPPEPEIRGLSFWGQMIGIIGGIAGFATFLFGDEIVKKATEWLGW